MLLYTARWLVPVSSPPILDGAVAINATGRLTYVGPAADAPPGETIPLGDAALTPGLRLRRRPHARPRARPRSSPPASARRCTSRSSGPTPDRRAAALETLRRDVAALQARVAATGAADRVRVGVVPRDMPTTDEDLLLDACAWAVGESLPIAIPAGRTHGEALYLREASGPYADARRAAGFDVVRRAHSTVHLLAELGIAAVARPLLVGAAYFDESDVALAAYYDCPVTYVRPLDAEPVLTPGEPVAALLDAGARVALTGTPDLLATAARLARSPDEALHLVTLGAARALDLAHATGSLDVGKDADICAFPFTAADLALAAARGPVHALVARPDRTPSLTVVGGRALDDAPPPQPSDPV